LLLFELPLLGLGSLLRGDSAGGLGGLGGGLSDLGLSVFGLSAGLSFSCAFETVAAAVPTKSADANVNTPKLFFVKFDFILPPPSGASLKTNLSRGRGKGIASSIGRIIALIWEWQQPHLVCFAKKIC